MPKISQQRELVSEKFYEYSDHREEILEEIKDSIQNRRRLSSEENKILLDLIDQYYDYHYNELVEVSKEGKKLMKIWNYRIKPFKKEYEKYTVELERLEKKFFQDYYLKYGMSFCHIVFKYGVIFNINCENGMLNFNKLIN